MSDVLTNEFTGTVSLGYGVRVTMPGESGEYPFTDPDSLQDWCTEAMMDGFDAGFAMITSAQHLRDNPGAPFEAWVGPRPHRWALDGRRFPFAADSRGMYDQHGLDRDLGKLLKHPYRGELAQGQGKQDPEFYVTLSDGVSAADVVFGLHVERGWSGELPAGVELFDQHPAGPWVLGVRITTLTERTGVIDFSKKAMGALRKQVKTTKEALGQPEPGRLVALPLP